MSNQKLSQNDDIKIYSIHFNEYWTDISVANTNTFKFSPRWSQTNLASKQKLSFTKTHHVDIGTFQQVIIMSEVANVSWSVQLYSQI